MSLFKSIPYTDPSNFTFDPDKIEVSASGAKLKLVPNPEQVFSQSFESSEGFVFDSDKAEFSDGAVKQTDQTPPDSVLAAKYTESEDANWNKQGGLAAAVNGSPELSGGTLQCFGQGKGVAYEVLNTGSGAIKCQYTPNYDQFPGFSSINIFALKNSEDNTSRIQLSHANAGQTLRLLIEDENGNVLVNTQAVGPNPFFEQGVAVEIELNWDSAAGVARLFLDGELHGTVSPGSWSHDDGSATLHIGAYTAVYNIANAAFDNVVFFNSAQHSASYTPGYDLPDFIFAGSTVQLPAFSYTGVGTVLSVDDSTIEETGTPRLIVAGRYWDGQEWALSDGSYGQASPSSEVIENLTEFNAQGAVSIPVSIVFPGTNTQSEMSLLSVEVTGQIYPVYASILENTGVLTDEFKSLAESSTLPGQSEIKYTLRVGGQDFWFTSGAWQVSDGTPEQANTLADVNTNALTFAPEADFSLRLRAVLVSSNEQQTPVLASNTLEYEFFVSDPGAPSRCYVYLWASNILAEPLPENSQAALIASLPRGFEHPETERFILPTKAKVLFNSNGFAQLRLIETETAGQLVEFEVQYKRDGKLFVLKLDPAIVPNQDTAALADMAAISES